MTTPQIFAFAILAAMMGLFVWGRLRYDIVAVLALLACLFTGIVPYDKAFSGFSDDIVIIVASALIVSAAVARSGMIEAAVRPIAPWLTTPTIQIFVLTAVVAALSGFVKNIGALAMMMPVAFQLARRTGTPASAMLMPMAFGSLLGGIVTLVGTSPNIIVSRVRQEILGEPFQMFDFAPVGVLLAIGGVAFLAFGWRLLPERKGAASLDAAFNLEGYTTEVSVPENSEFVGKTVRELETLSENEVEVLAILRRRQRNSSPTGGVQLRAGDIIILQGDPDALERIVGAAKLKLVRNEVTKDKDTPSDDIGVIEGIVTPESSLVGNTPVTVRLYDHFQINLLAVSRAGRRIAHRLRAVRFQPGDVIMLQGNIKTMPETLGDLRVLPLAERRLSLGRGRRGLIPVLVLAVAMLLVAVSVLPIAVAFFTAAAVIILLKSLSLREAYDAVEWPILIMLGTLIPVSDALRTTGGTDVIAGWLSAVATQLPPIGTLTLIMVAALAVTPFLNNAATVLVMGPIAATFAKTLGLSPDPFLMAVAIGAACDFLTPIGHQSNTLVMGAGGYQFTDYWKLGLPLSIYVVVAGVPLIALFWPLVPH
ncbi:SLC13 family permease [Pseudorhodoplanes sinuspersici]|uniref:SLC13 family permease n=1 Tax=Pseudorhodoplanes sinuspersici TaxID=1235591 RepID=A0A1W6ZUR6_9HYPH|nr:SLC13 family permease [Pseudorhodoplanes sinuspersici]ARQ00861.1 SLC13 family permease [Pseudorhodoplanes sinuspersici]RKE72480.1 di/tricarboxylate transporter [Pseudorhodoplanes sinuspersici]